MWTVIKYEKKSFGFLIQELKKKVGDDLIVYNPKLKFQKFINHKLISKSSNLIGDYVFCYHKKFEKKSFLQTLKFCRGLKYFLDGYLEFQSQIISFIKKCKYSEDSKGFISQSFYEIDFYKDYKFLSGPFSEKVFKIIGLKKNRINVLVGNLKTTVDKKDFLFSPV